MSLLDYAHNIPSPSLIPEDEDNAKTIAICNSLEILAQLHVQLGDIELEAQNANDMLTSVSITDYNHLDTVKSSVVKLTSHINDILSNSNTLVSRLQQPFTSDSFLVEESYQKDFVSVLKNCALLIVNIDSYITSLKETTSFSDHINKMNSQLSVIQSTYARYKRYFESTFLLNTTTNESFPIDIDINNEM